MLNLNMGGWVFNWTTIKVNQTFLSFHIHIESIKLNPSFFNNILLVTPCITNLICICRSIYFQNIYTSVHFQYAFWYYKAFTEKEAKLCKKSEYYTNTTHSLKNMIQSSFKSKYLSGKDFNAHIGEGINGLLYCTLWPSKSVFKILQRNTTSRKFSSCICSQRPTICQKVGP